MPAIAVAAVAAIAGAAASGVVAGAVTGAVIAGITISASTALIIGAVAGALVATAVGYGLSAALGLNRTAKAKPGSSNKVEAQDRKATVRSSVEPRRMVYGAARVSGPLVYASSSGPDLRYLHLVIPLAAHDVDGFESVWINDRAYPVAAFNGAGFLHGPGGGVPNAADIAAGGGDVADPLGVNLFRRPPDELRGATDPAIYETDGNVQNGMESLIRVRLYNGTQDTADDRLVAESSDGWDGAHVLRGIAYAYVRVTADEKRWSGAPNISVTVRGKPVYDPRSDAYAYSTNPALCVLDYLLSPDGLGCTTEEIDFASFFAAGNVCDEQVPNGAGGTFQRYTLDGVVTLDDTPGAIIDNMLSTCAGSLVYVQGQYRMHAGAYEAPTDSLTSDDMAGAVVVSTKPPRRDLFNAVRGTFIDPGRAWQASEFPVYEDPPGITEDGEVIWRDVELPMTTNAVRARMLAKLMVRRTREATTIRAPLRYAALRICTFQTVSVTLPEFGFTAKPFRVIDMAFDPQSATITATLREESAASFEVPGVNDAVPPAPDTNLVNPFNIPAPAGLAAREELYATRDGAGVRTRLVLTWAPAAHPFVNGYEVQAQRPGSIIFEPAGGTQGETSFDLDDLADGVHLVRVRARSRVAAGAWTTLQASVGALAAVPPVAVTGLALQAMGGIALLRWDRHPDLDVRAGGRFEIRHTPDLLTPTWINATLLGQAVEGGATSVVLPLMEGTYLIKAVDAGGRYSADAASIETTQASALPWANVATITEHPGFTGARTNTVVVSSTLRLGGSGDIDAVTSFDGIADVDGLGGVSPSGSYVFSGGLDLGSVRGVRLTARLLSTVVNTFDTIDVRGGAVDTWRSFDGVVGGEATAWVEVRHTPDNPGGSPVWTAWRRLDASEFRARGFQFRAQLRSDDPAFNIHVSELRVTADEVP